MVSQVVLVLMMAAIVACGPHHTPHPLNAIGHWIDMTYDYGKHNVHWPDLQDFELRNELRSYLAVGDDTFWMETNTVCSPEHIGTHIDAARQLWNDGMTVGKIPLSHLVAPGVMIDLTKEANADPDYRLTKERIMEWEREHGRIPLNAIIFMNHDWERRWPSQTDVYNTKTTKDIKTFHYPGLHPDAAEWLVKERSIIGLAIDTPSLDAGQEFWLRAHYTVMPPPHNIYCLELVANMSRLPPTNFDVFVGALKFDNGTGGPARVAAFVLKDDPMSGGLYQRSQHMKHKVDNIVVSYASKNVAEWVDLTHSVTQTIPRWPSISPFNITDTYIETDPHAMMHTYCMGEHIGTHVDAPRHMSKNGLSINEIPLDHLMGVPGVKISIREKAMKNPNAALDVEDIKAWERQHGKIPTGSVVFLEFGWNEKWSSPEAYLGTKVPGDSDTFNFPGYSEKSVEWLIRERHITGLGTEGASLDVGNTRHMRAHRALLGANLYGIEMVANLDQLPDKDFTVFVMPYKILGGSGGNARVFAVKEAAYRVAVETLDPEPEPEPESRPAPKRPKTRLFSFATGGASADFKSAGGSGFAATALLLIARRLFLN